MAEETNSQEVVETSGQEQDTTKKDFDKKSNTENKTVQKLKTIWKTNQGLCIVAIIFFVVSILILVFGGGKEDKTVFGVYSFINTMTGTFTVVLAFMAWYNTQSLLSTMDAAPMDLRNTSEGDAFIFVGTGKDASIQAIQYLRNTDELRGILESKPFKVNASETSFHSENIVYSAITVNPAIEKNDNNVQLFMYNVRQDDGTKTGKILQILLKDNMPTEGTALDKYAKQMEETVNFVNRMLAQSGVSVVHVIVAGPASPGMFLINTISNQFDINLYHQVGGSNYSLIFKMTKSGLKAVTDEHEEAKDK